MISSIVKNLEYFDSVLLQDSDKNLLNEQISHLNSINSKMSKWKSMSLQLITITEKISDETSEINKSFSKVDAIFEKATLGARSIEEVKELIASARESKITIESKLDSSSALYQNSQKNLWSLVKLILKFWLNQLFFMKEKSIMWILLEF